MKHDRVTRLVVIDHRTMRSGVIVEVRPCSVETQLQDDGRTLKVFIDDPKPGT